VTLAQIAESLPNRFHDAEIAHLEIDYAARTLRIDMNIWVGSMDDLPERREAYRKGIVSVSGLKFCSLQLPDPNYPFAGTSGIVVEDVASSEHLLSTNLLNKVGRDSFVQSFFVREWNSLIHVCGTAAELNWVSEEVSYR
jgi:hypothetical protein